MKERNVLLTFCCIVHCIKPSYILINTNLRIKTTAERRNVVGKNNDANKYFNTGAKVRFKHNSGIKINVVKVGFDYYVIIIKYHEIEWNKFVFFIQYLGF